LKLNKFETLEIGKVLDHIIDKTQYITKDTTKIGDASKLMLDNKYDLVAIVDSNGKVSQVVSKSDITHLLSNQITLDPQKLLQDIATRLTYTPIHNTDSTKKLLDMVIQNKIDNTVIVDTDGKYYGIINKNTLRSAIDEIVE